MIIGYFSSTFPYNYSNPDYFCGGSCLATQSLVNEIKKKNLKVKVFQPLQIQRTNGLQVNMKSTGTQPELNITSPFHWDCLQPIET
jgi:hypothetical protein